MAQIMSRLSNGLDLAQIGERIRLRRLQRRLTLEELAGRAREPQHDFGCRARH